MPKSNEYIKLDQFLKVQQVVASGGEAKHLIATGLVNVNDGVEIRRGRKLYHGDVVWVDDQKFLVLFE